MLKKILTALAVAIACFVGIVMIQPTEFKVTRTATISASAETLFEQVNDLHNWQAWSPWAKLDPDAKSSFEGAPSGKGAVMRWDGNDNVGAGSMTITDSNPNNRVEFRLDFLRPFAATNMAEFTFTPQGNQTTLVSWSMAGRNGFMGKAVGLIMNCEKMIGEQFDEGLNNLKKLVEEK